jgi:hypothetical protein
VPSYVDWLGITSSKYYNFKIRSGRVNCHNGTVPLNQHIFAVGRAFYTNDLAQPLSSPCLYLFRC